MREWLLYQAVTPGEPEGKGRSCLTGETEVVEVDDDGTIMGGVDRSRVRALERGVLVRECGREGRTSLTVREDGSKTYASLLASGRI